MSARSDKVPAVARGTAAGAVLELGKKLVIELGLEDTVDTLGRWMAHYVAELVADVEVASPADRPEKEARCAAAILELWRHRHDVPHGRGQFEAVPLLRAIASLDPDAPRHRYFARLREGAEGKDDAVRSWLRLADGIDAAARMLVVQCLVAAAAEAGDKSQEWIVMADAAGIEDDAPAIALRFVSEQKEFLEEVEPDEANQERLSHRLKWLRTFVKLAPMLENQLTGQLEAIADSASRSATVGKAAKRGRPHKAAKSRGGRKSGKHSRKRNTN